MRPERPVEPIQHQARLDRDPALLPVEAHDRMQVLAEVHDERFATVCPHCEVPAPRARRGTPYSAAMATMLATSASVRGTVTPMGSIW